LGTQDKVKLSIQINKFYGQILSRLEVSTYSNEQSGWNNFGLKRKYLRLPFPMKNKRQDYSKLKKILVHQHWAGSFHSVRSLGYGLEDPGFVIRQAQ